MFDVITSFINLDVEIPFFFVSRNVIIISIVELEGIFIKLFEYLVIIMPLISLAFGWFLGILNCTELYN